MSVFFIRLNNISAVAEDVTSFRANIAFTTLFFSKSLMFT